MTLKVYVTYPGAVLEHEGSARVVLEGCVRWRKAAAACSTSLDTLKLRLDEALSNLT